MISLGIVAFLEKYHLFLFFLNIKLKRLMFSQLRIFRKTENMQFALIFHYFSWFILSLRVISTEKHQKIELVEIFLGSYRAALGQLGGSTAEIPLFFGSESFYLIVAGHKNSFQKQNVTNSNIRTELNIDIIPRLSSH